MKEIEQIKQEIRELINEAADQGVLITEISAEFCTVMEGRVATTYMQIKETRLKWACHSALPYSGGNLAG